MDKKFTLWWQRLGLPHTSNTHWNSINSVAEPYYIFLKSDVVNYLSDVVKTNIDKRVMMNMFADIFKKLEGTLDTMILLDPITGVQETYDFCDSAECYELFGQIKVSETT